MVKKKLRLHLVDKEYILWEMEWSILYDIVCERAANIRDGHHTYPVYTWYEVTSLIEFVNKLKYFSQYYISISLHKYCVPFLCTFWQHANLNNTVCNSWTSTQCRGSSAWGNLTHCNYLCGQWRPLCFRFLMSQITWCNVY